MTNTRLFALVCWMLWIGLLLAAATGLAPAPLAAALAVSIFCLWHLFLPRNGFAHGAITLGSHRIRPRGGTGRRTGLKIRRLDVLCGFINTLSKFIASTRLAQIACLAQRVLWMPAGRFGQRN
jgi:hypothetical protein